MLDNELKDDPNGFYYYINGVKCYDEEKCVEFLLKEGILYIGAYNPCRTKEDGSIEKSNKEFATLTVNVNDIFVYGAMHIALEYDDIPKLYEYCIDPNNKDWGFVIWACEKLKEKPIFRVIEHMKEDGVWKDEYDRLWEPNYIDSKFNYVKESCTSAFLIIKNLFKRNK